MLLTLAGSLSAAPALGADHSITAGPAPTTYTTPEVTIDQGDTITFTNSDASGATHDVTSDATDAGGKRLFKSALVAPGKSGPVDGVQYLTTGDYAFHCSIHSSMHGTIHVSANGTPQQRPVAPPPDTTPPDATVAIADTRIGAVLKRKGLRVKLKANERARFKMTAKSGRATLATGTATVTDKSRTAVIKLTSAGRRYLAKARSVVVKLSAKVNDAANNRSSAAATRKLRR